MAPDPIVLSTLAYTLVGTGLAVASANALNQYLEVDSDLLMRRTQLRTLPAGELSLRHALTFGLVTGVAGSALLAAVVNPLAAALAALNIILYVGVYTPMKKRHWLNTWVGAVVGAIPPLIGWAGATGTLGLGAWLLFYALFVWQIPHFLALSWPLAADYTRAEYAMLVVSAPERVPILTLRYAVYLAPLPLAAVGLGITTPAFLLTGGALSAWLVAACVPFYRSPSAVAARRAFMATIYYLPLLLLLLLVHRTADWALAQDDEEERVKEGATLKSPL